MKCAHCFGIDVNEETVMTGVCVRDVYVRNACLSRSNLYGSGRRSVTVFNM